MNSHLKAAVVGGVAGAVMVIVVGAIGLLTLAHPLFAQSFPGGAGRDMAAPPQAAATPVPTTQMTHEQMHQMMDAMHGAGASDRMHEAMGADAEKLMDQCVGMMNMMGSMMGMMQGGQGMMGGGGMQGMMGGR